MLIGMQELFCMCWSMEKAKWVLTMQTVISGSSSGEQINSVTSGILHPWPVRRLTFLLWTSVGVLSLDRDTRCWFIWFMPAFWVLEMGRWHKKVYISRTHSCRYASFLSPEIAYPHERSSIGSLGRDEIAPCKGEDCTHLLVTSRHTDF